MTNSVAPEALALQRLYHWEKTCPDKVVLTQPIGGGEVREYTWRQLMDESRRMAAHLQAMGFEPGAHIAMLAKNTAHWLMADFAIWMAGYVSVPLYPTLAAGTVRQILEHSEARLLFIGKLDGWDAMREGIPDDLPRIRLPLAPAVDCPAWEDIVAATPPLRGCPVRDGDDLATIIYTSGTTGVPKGVMHSFATFAWSIQAVIRRIGTQDDGRALSYLPLAHVAERTVIEHWHAIVASRDHDGLDELLADDVVFQSPALHTPQVGKGVTKKYLVAAFHVLDTGQFRYVGEWLGERSAVLRSAVSLVLPPAPTGVAGV